jgi:hypothetical protein
VSKAWPSEKLSTAAARSGGRWLAHLALTIAWALLLAQSRTTANNFKQQPKHDEADDTPDYHYRDEGLLLGFCLTFSCGYYV